ncbi:hypothetical protein M3Y96_01001400 [Aphelenchoides besseyi]|nr:hypothetical protein M3Y96_01001400 [Aphelenchoides besseyi]
MSRRGKFAKVNRAFDQHSIKDFFKAAVKRKAPTDDNTDDPPLKQMAPEVITLDDSPVKPMAARPVSIELQDAADLCTPFAEINNTLNNNAEPSTPVLNNSEELVEFNDDELYAPKQLSNFDFACSTFGASVYAIGPHSELQSALQLPSGHAKKSAILMSVKNIGTSGVRPLKIRAYEYRYWHKKFKGNDHVKMVRIHKTTTESTEHSCIFHEVVFWGAVLHEQKHLFDNTNFAQQVGNPKNPRYRLVPVNASYTTSDAKFCINQLIKCLKRPVFIEAENRHQWATHCRDKHGYNNIDDYLFVNIKQRSYENHREYYNAKGKKYRDNHKEECAEYQKRYWEINGPKIKAAKRERRRQAKETNRLHFLLVRVRLLLSIYFLYDMSFF